MPDNNRDRVLKPSGRFEWEQIFRRVSIKPPSAKLLGFILASYANYETGDEAHPGQAKLAAMTGVSDRQVRSGLKILEELGLIEQVSRGSSKGRGAKGQGIATVYRLTIPSDLFQFAEVLDDDDARQSDSEVSDRKDRKHSSGAKGLRTGSTVPEFPENTGSSGDKHRKFRAETPEAHFRPHLQETHLQETHRTARTSASHLKPVDNFSINDENPDDRWTPQCGWGSPFDEQPPF